MITYSVIIGVITAYLIGSIATSVWIGRVFFGVDIRKLGSGNAGATNTIRVLGTKQGLIVLLFDTFKGWFAVFLAQFFAPDFYTYSQVSNLELVHALAAVLGHIFPIYVGFKGGKGVATLVGVIIALYPSSFVVLLGVFLIVLITSGYVSLSSITTAVVFPFIYIFIFKDSNSPISLIIFAILIAVFIPFTHKKNIIRLLNGTENKFRLKKREKH
ncbi:MAG: glycerol-3-phosphate 1-O-acyltransferase PlsY [Bacteroidetes bacterium]|nr:glycerol-3-phosphate 1-O-acyltransferase PlsY [Bacteroidota bacterium]